MNNAMAVQASDLRFFYAWAFASLQYVDGQYRLAAGSPLPIVRAFDWGLMDFMLCMTRLEQAALVELQGDGDTTIPDSIGAVVWFMVNPVVFNMDGDNVPF